ncbi:27556_t:CDS:2, partial [Dentiscutata erythropus]
KLVPVVVKWNQDTTIVQWKEYVERISRENINMFNDVIYIDESDFNLHLCHSRGCAPRGKPAIKEVATQRGKNITIIAAMSGNEIIKTSCCLSSTTEIVFSKVKNLVAKHPLDSQETILERIEEAFNK